MRKGQIAEIGQSKVASRNHEGAHYSKYLYNLLPGTTLLSEGLRVYHKSVSGAYRHIFMLKTLIIFTNKMLIEE